MANELERTTSVEVIPFAKGQAVYRVKGAICEHGRLQIAMPEDAEGSSFEILCLPKLLSEPSRVFPFSTTEMIIRQARPPRANAGDQSFALGIDSFDDLAVLFERSPLTRGFVRMDIDEAAAVYRALRQFDAPRGVEIGRFNGGSTLLLAVAGGTDGTLRSIDVSPQDDEYLKGVLERNGLAMRVELVVGDSNQVDASGMHDYVFIDGDHSYDSARRDHNRWGKAVRPGGLVIHHDMACSRPFSTQWADLARLRENILQQQSECLRLEEEAGSIAIFRRTEAGWNDIP